MTTVERDFCQRRNELASASIRNEEAAHQSALLPGVKYADYRQAWRASSTNSMKAQKGKTLGAGIDRNRQRSSNAVQHAAMSAAKSVVIEIHIFFSQNEIRQRAFPIYASSGVGRRSCACRAERFFHQM